MTDCKFLKYGKCCAIGYSVFPTCASVMGYCMAVVENRLEECDWFTEDE